MPVFGLMAAIASLGIVIFGLPKQIYKNHTRKTCEGLEPILVYSVACAYTLWSLYGLTKPDWFLATSQVPGVLLSGILIFQIHYYGTESREMPL